MDLKDVVDDKKLSVIQKHGRLILEIILIMVITYQYRQSESDHKKFEDYILEQLKQAKEDKKDDKHFDQLIQRYEKQVEIVKPDKPESFSNDKTIKQDEKDGH